MHYEMMTVTPELAQRWLNEKNNRNRNIAPKKVDAYADDILLGRWQKTHQNAIAFYKDGNLADGQHRLAAIVKAKIPVELMVWWGLDDHAAYGIDAHRMRNTHDQIKIAGSSGWITKDIIACARLLIPGKQNISSPQKIAEFCNAHMDALLFAHDVVSRASGPAPLRAAVAFAWYYEDHEKLRDWGSIMSTGIGSIPLSRTVLTLRERLIKDKLLRAGAGGSREQLMRLSMRSIQAYCAGEVLTKLYEPKERIYEFPS